MRHEYLVSVLSEELHIKEKIEIEKMFVVKAIETCERLDFRIEKG